MKTVLFVCVENACRSQMAEAFARKLGAGRVAAYSAGSRPRGAVDPDAVRAMNEAGIDIAPAVSKGFDDLPLREFDYVVTMGCRDACPLAPAVRRIDWDIPDPKGRDAVFFREVRDRIERQVWDLIAEIAP
ncbi:MAG: arsenate reductase ArsC [Deltaproteobacteria bacterium]